MCSLVKILAFLSSQMHTHLHTSNRKRRKNLFYLSIKLLVLNFLCQHINLCRVRQLIRHCDKYVQLKSVVLPRNSSGHLFDSCQEISSGM